LLAGGGFTGFAPTSFGLPQDQTDEFEGIDGTLKVSSLIVLFNKYLKIEGIFYAYVM